MRTGNKVRRSYTISEEANKTLETLAEKWDVSKTRVIENLLEISPENFPEKRVTVWSINPIIVETQKWDEEYTGDILVWFPYDEGIRQITTYVKELTFDNLARWIERLNDYKHILIPKGENNG